MQNLYSHLLVQDICEVFLLLRFRVAILHTRLDGMTGLLSQDFYTQTGLGQHVDIGWCGADSINKNASGLTPGALFTNDRTEISDVMSRYPKGGLEPLSSISFNYTIWNKLFHPRY